MQMQAVADEGGANASDEDELPVPTKQPRASASGIAPGKSGRIPSGSQSARPGGVKRSMDPEAGHTAKQTHGNAPK